jgi:O-antigen/teichoic acid export membrane protein
MLMFLLLAVQLDPGGYGDLQAVMSIAIIAGPLATFGATWKLLRAGVHIDDIRSEVGRAVSTAATGTTAAALVLILLFLVLPDALPGIDRMTMALILLAQMPAFWLVEVAFTAAVLRAELQRAAQIRTAAVAVRLLGLFSFMAFGAGTVDSWAWYFLVSNLGAAVAAHALLVWYIGRPTGMRLPTWPELRSGIPYGVGNTTEGLLASSDRPVLTQFGFRAETGLYSAGYRIVSIGLMPMLALFKAQDRKFFRDGAAGAVAGLQAGILMARQTLVVTIPVAIGLWLLAPFVDDFISLVGTVLGRDSTGEVWAETEAVIRPLALLPVIKGVQFAYGNSLTAAGLQKDRMWLTGAAAIGNLIGNLVLIPSRGWPAAVGTTLVAEVALTLAFMVTISAHAREETGRSWRFGR